MTYETEYYPESIFMGFLHFFHINKRGWDRTRMECTGSQIFNYENPFKNYENSHMIIQEILASIN